MNTILRTFVNEPLFDACAAMLNHLHIEFNEVTRTPVPFEGLYRNPLTKALQEIMSKVDHTYFIGTVDEASLSGHAVHQDENDVTTKASEGKYIGMMIFAVDIKGSHTLTRTEMATLTRGFNRIAAAQPVVLFIKQGDHLALATCERSEYTQQWRDGEKLGKVSLLRGINCLHPHRGHIDILESIGDKAYPTFEELYKHWMQVFSNELLTEKFYEELQNWYFWAVKNVVFPNNINDDKDDAMFNNENIIHLITRFIFVWFLKEKGLVNPDLFNEKKLQNILKDFHPQSEEGNYYVAIIQNLFFATLNQEIGNRKFVGKWDPSHHSIKTLYRNRRLFLDNMGEKDIIDLFNRSPYVNGSLFECLDNKERDGKMFCWDGFSESKTTKDGMLKQALIPNYLFFTPEHGKEVDMQTEYGKEKSYIVKVSGLLTILEKYHFTIEENTPLDEDVALDPELLGRAFENLLGAFNPETQTTARENTGSYYTPRDIVNYMVSESILEHLKTHCPDIPSKLLESVIDYNKAEKPEGITEEQTSHIVNAIYHCRVIDPACGSGAFPMGVLQMMVHILRKLDGTNKYWYNIVLEQALEEVKLAEGESQEEYEKLTTEINKAFDSKVNEPDYARKLYIIEKCIYGVDIQTVAVQISRLRCFISLLCEQPVNEDPEDNYGIKPLPNLESNFVAANTLFSLGLTKEEETLLRENAVAAQVAKLREVRHLLFLPRDKQMKMRLRKKDAQLRQEIKRKVGEVYALRLQEAIDRQQEAIDAIMIWLDTEGKSIEASKLVEVSEYDIFGNLVTKTKKQATKKTQMMESLKLATKEKERLQHDNRLAQVMHKIDQLVSWDPFDQNVSNPYFEPEWMLGVEDKFDIVIGNPPYISSQDQLKDPILREQRERLTKDERFKMLFQKWDLYIAFMELATRYMVKSKGICTMIVPYPLTNQLYGKKLREYLVQEEDLLEIVDLNGIKVFKSVTVSNCIPFIRHSHTNDRSVVSKGYKADKILINHEFVQPHDRLVQNDKTQVWNLSQEKRRSDAHSSMNVLGDFGFISFGLRLNSDEKTAKGEFRKADLISKCYDEIHCRKLIEGKDLERYRIKRVRYVEWNTERCPQKLVRPTFREFYDYPKIFCNYLGNLTCMVDFDNCFIHTNLITGIVLWKDLHSVNNKSITSSIKKYSRLTRPEMEALSEKVDLRYLLGILNSQYASVLLTNLRGGDYHIYPEHIRNIPIPSATKEQQQPIVELVDKILAAKKDNAQADTTVWEEEIDRIVYALYGVKDTEISDK